tara:strand:- start:409 stop:1374 length:966 start_codon:yes stop_codon:yes gene_type:complete
MMTDNRPPFFELAASASKGGEKIGYWSANFIKNWEAARQLGCAFKFFLCVQTSPGRQWKNVYCKVPALLSVAQRWPSIEYVVQLDTDAVIRSARAGGLDTLFASLQARPFTHLAHHGASLSDTAVDVRHEPVNASVVTSLTRSCGLPPGLCHENRHVANLHCACIMIWRLNAHGRGLARRWMTEALDDKEPHYPGGHCFTREQDAFNRIARADRLAAGGVATAPRVVGLPAAIFDESEGDRAESYIFTDSVKKGGCERAWWERNSDPELLDALTISHRNKRDHTLGTQSGMPSMPSNVSWPDVQAAIEPLDYSAWLRTWQN